MEEIIQKYLQKSEFKKALNLLEIYKDKESNNVALNYYFGKVYFQLNDHKKSLFYFRKCNQINPGNPQILYNLAQVLQGQGKIDEAKKIYEKLIKQNSTDIKSYYGLFNLGIKNINDDHEIKLQKLSNDIFMYYGLGCRSVSKIYLPKDYDLDILFKQVYSWKDIINNSSYYNNYTYNKTI